MPSDKTVIVTGASHGIGAAVVQAFLGRAYNVVQLGAAFPRRALRRHRTAEDFRSLVSTNLEGFFFIVSPREGRRY